MGAFSTFNDSGNLIALRQNIVRLMAYSGVAQTGFMIAPLAVAGHSLTTGDQALSAVITYLAIYAAMNLGAFAVIITGKELAPQKLIHLPELSICPRVDSGYDNFSIFPCRNSTSRRVVIKFEVFDFSNWWRNLGLFTRCCRSYKFCYSSLLLCINCANVGR